jgi:hypothetical protein
LPIDRKYSGFVVDDLSKILLGSDESNLRAKTN